MRGLILDPLLNVHTLFVPSCMLVAVNLGRSALWPIARSVCSFALRLGFVSPPIYVP